MHKVKNIDICSYFHLNIMSKTKVEHKRGTKFLRYVHAKEFTPVFLEVCAGHV